MHQFKDLGITTVTQSFTGDKIKVERLLNREITVHAFKIEPSKYKDKGNGKCLSMQISVGDTKHVVFTGSGVLQDTIQKVPSEKFPFVTTIVKNNEHYQFT